jgi:hypothetical protein
MKMINSTDKTMHSQIMKLLPWYVNHTANDNDRKLIDAHLQSCVSCRIELKYQQQFAEKVKSSSDFEFAPKQSFAQLKSRIHQFSDSGSATRTQNTERPPFYRRWLDGFQATLLTPQAAIVMASFCILLFSIDHIVTNRLSVTTNQFRTLSAAGLDKGVSTNDLRVVFETTITHEQIKRIVSSAHARVIDGPSLSGVYRIRVDETSGQKPISLDQVIHLLRKHKQVVFVEPTYTALVSILRK